MITEEEIREKIKELGAVEIDRNTGYFPVKSTLVKPRILEYNEYEIPTILSTAQNFFAITKRKAVLGAKYVFAEGIFTRIFKKTCTKYHDPKISFKIYPTAVKKAVVHLLSFKITGEVETKFENHSEEGEEGKTSVWRWQSCPTKDSEYEWEKVKGSANLNPAWSHRFVEDSTGVVLGDISDSTDVVKLNSSATSVAKWNTGDIFEYFWSLLQLLLTGTITTRNGFDVTVTYKWLGSNVSKTKHVDAKVVLPVKKVDYVFD